jgi:hypothetical protein
MSKISRESAPDVTDNGPAEDRGAYRRLRRHLHLDPSGLGPHAAAQRGRRATAARAHTGNMSRRGRLTVQYGDREGIIEPGDAFCMPPGHVPAAVAGTDS